MMRTVKSEHKEITDKANDILREAGNTAEANPFFASGSPSVGVSLSVRNPEFIGKRMEILSQAVEILEENGFSLDDLDGKSFLFVE